MRSILRIGSLAIVLAATAVQAQTDLPPGTWPIGKAPAEWRPAIARADLVVVSLHDALRRELTHALAQGGPAFAIKACHIDVAGLTQRISGRAGIPAGRTSDRLRNPANAPPSWAAPLVAGSGVKRLARDTDGFVVDLDRSLGVLRPILHQRMCDSCHGPADRIDPAVQAMLAVRYPGDRATGFVEGQLRGWFWSKCPSSPSERLSSPPRQETTMRQIARASNHEEPRGAVAIARHYIGDLIYGANDGLITTFAVVAAVSGGALSTRTVLIVGLANLLADGLSMGVGNYLSIRSHEGALTAQGLPEEEASPARHGIATFLAFVFAGAMPLVPYAAGAGMSLGLAFSVAVTFAMLFAVGALRALVTVSRWWSAGAEMLLLGVIVAVAAYISGAVVSSLVGGAL